MKLDEIGGADKAYELYVDEQVGTHLKLNILEHIGFTISFYFQF
jgi:hypothetical protein